MTSSSQDSALELTLAANSSAAQPQSRSEREGIVIHLFDQLQARLSSYVLAFGIPHHDAEDIVQETFVSLFHHLERGRPRWNLNGWLFRVAHNLALKRRTANQAAVVHVDHQDALAQHPDPAHNAEEQLAFSQTQQRLLAVFQALPELDRRCLHLRAEGLKYREIADTLGISLGSVSISLSRSLTRMNRAIGGDRK
jgi:RNA polymerase sigma-70 factor, ECF subfamily